MAKGHNQAQSTGLLKLQASAAKPLGARLGAIHGAVHNAAIGDVLGNVLWGIGPSGALRPVVLWGQWCTGAVGPAKLQLKRA